MNQFEKNYFVNSSISNYIDYRKKKFESQVSDLVNILKLKKTDSILDFGCATGGLLRCLKERGFTNIQGTDISCWAIEYGKSNFDLQNELEFYNRNLLYCGADYIFMFDVLEHLSDGELEIILKLARNGLAKKLLVRVPISLNEGEDYFLDVSKNDKTHIQIHCKDWWIEMLNSFGFIFQKEIECETIYCSSGVFSGIFI